MITRETVARAEQLARIAHAGQFRRDGVTPYIVHPQAVAARVAGDPAAESVAWLHDVLEDTAVTETTLREHGIPEGIVSSVRLLTKPEGADYGPYLHEIRRDPVARKVKIADMLSNLSDQPSERQILKYAQGLIVLLSEPPPE